MDGMRDFDSLPVKEEKDKSVVFQLLLDAFEEGKDPERDSTPVPRDFLTEMTDKVAKIK